MAIFVCLTAGEWRNLSSVGYIRIHSNRAIPLLEVELSIPQFSLFSTSPDRFSIGESSDLIVAELIDCWNVTRSFYPHNLTDDMQWLTLENVISFSPVQNKDKWVFESDAERIGVRLSDAKFEELWFSWVKEDSVRAAAINGGKLINICGLNDSKLINFDGITYGDMSRLAAIPDSIGSPDDCLLQKLLRHKEVLFDSCREDLDTCAFFISCAVEWANLHTGGNVLESTPIIESTAIELHGKLQEVPWNFSVIADPILGEFLNELTESVPASFSGSCKPRTIALYARYCHQIRFGKTHPEEILDAIKAAQVLDGPDSGRLLAFLLGVALGGGRVQSLARHLHNYSYNVALPIPTPPESQPACEPEPVRSLQSLANAATASDVINPFLESNEKIYPQLNPDSDSRSEWLEVLNAHSGEVLDRLLVLAELTDYFLDHEKMLQDLDLIKDVIEKCPSARCQLDTKAGEDTGDGAVWYRISTIGPEIFKRELRACIEEYVRGAGYSASCNSEPLVQRASPNHPAPPPPEPDPSDPT